MATSHPVSLDLQVPRITTSLDYVDYTYSRVKLAPGLFKAIRFEAWDEFDDITKRTKEKLQRLDPEILANVMTEVNSIRHKVDPSTKHENVKLADALKRLYASSRKAPLFERGSFCTGSTEATVHLDEQSADASTPSDASECHGTLSNPPAHLKRFLYTNSTSCTRVNSKVFDLVEKLIRYVRCEEQYVLLSEMKLSSEAGKAYGGLVSPKDFCNIVPDIALTTTQDLLGTKLPICSYEIKGPLRAFWRHDKQKDPWRPSKKQRSSVPINPRRARSSDTLDEQILSIGRQEDPECYSADGLANFYNGLLSDSTLMTRNSDKSSYYYVFLPVAQAVLQALLTESGCSALYTHQEAVAFEVYKPVKRETSVDSADNEWRPIRVRVSRAFACDKEPGNICALVALANHSCDRAASEGRKREVRDLFSVLTHRQYELRLQKPQKTQEKRGDDGQGGVGPSSTEGAVASRSAKKSAMDDSWRHRASCHASSDSVMVSSGMSDDEFARALADIIGTNDGVIGFGSSAIVLGGYYKGHRVAIKSWNGVNREGLLCFLHEIEMYEFLLRCRSTILGNVVPFVRIAKASPEEDAVLIIDRVGETVKRTTDGHLVMRSGNRWVVLHQKEVQALGLAAVSSLRILHTSDILHGDISMRNLRAQRCDEPFSNLGSRFNYSWRAWWIDLGLSRKCPTRLEKEIEIGDCALLFPEASIDVAISTRECY